MRRVIADIKFSYDPLHFFHIHASDQRAKMSRFFLREYVSEHFLSQFGRDTDRDESTAVRQDPGEFTSFSGPAEYDYLTWLHEVNTSPSNILSV